MRFMLMMHAPRGKTGDYQVNSWSQDDLKAHIAFMQNLNADLKKSGVKIMYEEHVRESGRSVYFFDPEGNYLQIHTPL